MRIYPDYRQRQLIELNGNISRTIYNRLVGIDQELYQLRKTKHHDDYFKLIDYLILNKDIDREFAEFMVDHHYVSAKTIQKAKAKHCYNYVGNSNLMVNQQRIDQLESRKNMRNLSSHYQYMQNSDIDSLTKANADQNHALAQSISDVSWRLFLQKLQVKGQLLDKQVILVSPRNTTQTCSTCGYLCGSDERHNKLTLRERKWTCPVCHTKHIRDINAAINILNKGITQLT